MTRNVNLLKLIDAAMRVVEIRDWRHDEDGAARRAYDGVADDQREILNDFQCEEAA